MRVRSGRFIAVLLMAGYPLAAGNASPGRVQWHAEVCSAPPCGCDVRSVSSCEPTMTSADACLITPRVAAWRAVQTGKSDCVFARFGSGQSPQPSAWFVSGTARPGGAGAGSAKLLATRLGLIADPNVILTRAAKAGISYKAVTLVTNQRKLRARPKAYDISISRVTHGSI